MYVYICVRIYVCMCTYVNVWHTHAWKLRGPPAALDDTHEFETETSGHTPRAPHCACVHGMMHIYRARKNASNVHMCSMHRTVCNCECMMDHTSLM